MHMAGGREDGGRGSRLAHQTPAPTGSSVLFLCLPASLPYGAAWGVDCLEICFRFPKVQVHESGSSTGPGVEEKGAGTGRERWPASEAPSRL